MSIVCKCQKTLWTWEEHAGKLVKCPVCGQELLIPAQASRGYDVFISHSNNDKPIAEAICANLESNGIRCWIAPRDIIPGTEWIEAIIDGINQCRAMVFVFSSRSNQSEDVCREILCAVKKGLVIIPFRTEDIPMSKTLEYLLGKAQWLNAIPPPPESHLTDLVSSVMVNLWQPSTSPPRPAPAPPGPEPTLPPGDGSQPSSTTVKEAEKAGEPPPAASAVAQPAVSSQPSDTVGTDSSRATVEALVSTPEIVAPLGTTPAPRSRPFLRLIVRVLLLIALLWLVGVLVWPARHPSWPLRSAPPLLAGDGPPYSPIVVPLSPSAYWFPQTHPNCQAISSVQTLRDGQTIEVRGDFRPGRLEEQKAGEIVVFVTQGAVGPEHVTTFALQEMSMEIKVSAPLDVSFFIDDDGWRNCYWSLPTQKHSGWQRVVLDAATAGRWQTPEFKSDRLIAVGWQFRSDTYRGSAQIQLRNVQLRIVPTNLVSAVRRVPRGQFLRQCGMDFPAPATQCNFGTPIEGGSHQGFSVRRKQLRSSLASLANHKASLVRIALFGNLSAGVRLNDRGQIAALDPMVYSDVDALLEEVSRHDGMRLLFVLFDGTLASRWPNLMLSAAERRLLCDRVLSPLFSRYASSKVIYGMEVLSDPEGVAEAHGKDTTRKFVDDVLGTLRSNAPRWKAVIGHRFRGGEARFQFAGFDVHLFQYDWASERHEPLKIRRDCMSFPPADVPVIVLAKIPSMAATGGGTTRPPFAPYGIQDAFDYGYSGTILSACGDDAKGALLPPDEAEAFAGWMSGEAESDIASYPGEE